MSPPSWRGRLAAAPDPPELPERARPRWPAWHGPVALVGSFMAIGFVATPFLPVVFLSAAGEAFAAFALLLLLAVQDGVLMGAAVFLGATKIRPRPWHFGIRPTPLWPTLGWTALAFALLLGFEVGYVELLDVEETNVDELGSGNLLAAVFVSIAVIVVAPVGEEFFFRAFFYRALRTRLRVWSASLIDGVVFGALHFEGPSTAIILPVIAVFGVVQCLVYERTGSLFAVIAIHAAFNTFAMLGVFAAPALVTGLALLAACLAVPRGLDGEPSPFGRDPRLKAVPA